MQARKLLKKKKGVSLTVIYCYGPVVDLISDLSHKKEFENDQRFKNFNAVKKCFKYIDEAVQVLILTVNLRFLPQKF